MTQVENKVPEVKKSNGLWASIWRSHFYAGIFAGPVLIWLALTGLVILYAGPLDNVLHKNLNYVPIASTQVPLSQQVAAVEEAAPHSTLSSVKPPARAGETTVVVMSDSSGNMLNYYVNPYTGVITGSNNGDDLVAFANRTHGSILPRQWSVSLPTLNGLLGTGATMQPIELGEILVEVFAGWGLVLAVSGIAMWWPRSRGRRKRWIPKMSGKGRAKWKGLHTTGGIVLAGFLFFSVVSGLPWASFWGSNWHPLATTLTPNQDGSDFWSDAAPNSPLPTLGSVTRFGVTIPWAAQTDHIPNSAGVPVTTVSIDAIQRRRRLRECFQTQPMCRQQIISRQTRRPMVPGLSRIHGRAHLANRARSISISSLQKRSGKVPPSNGASFRASLNWVCRRTWEPNLEFGLVFS